MADTQLGLEPLRNSIALDNLKRLSTRKLAQRPPLTEDPSKVDLDTLKKWSNDNLPQIKQAVANRVFGGPKSGPQFKLQETSIDWNNAFLTFMESSVMYARDFAKVVKAVKLYNAAVTDEAIDEAVQVLRSADDGIREVAAIWEMDFEVLTDLVYSPPDGHPTWDGPYSGAFWPTNTSGPFIGISFKGTNPGNTAEDLVDWNFQPTQSPSDIVFGTNVSTGDWTGMFNTFSGLPDDQYPFEYIYAQVQVLASKIAGSTGPVITHATGHSLGAAYGSLCYAQLLQFTSKSKMATSIALGDIYTFGSPRLGLADWSDAVYNAQNPNGSSWRVVNGDDFVPQVPPLKSKDPVFIHLDTAWRVFPDAVPTTIPTERGTTPPPPSWNPFKVAEEIKHHMTPAYYASLVFASTGQAPPS